MKITIDDTTKTIEIEEDVNLNDLFEFLTDIGIVFKEYKIVSKDVPHPYPYPVYPQWPNPYDPVPPWEGPIITYQTSIS